MQQADLEATLLPEAEQAVELSRTLDEQAAALSKSRSRLTRLRRELGAAAAASGDESADRPGTEQARKVSIAPMLRNRHHTRARADSMLRLSCSSQPCSSDRDNRARAPTQSSPRRTRYAAMTTERETREACERRRGRPLPMYTNDAPHVERDCMLHNLGARSLQREECVPDAYVQSLQTVLRRSKKPRLCSTAF